MLLNNLQVFFVSVLERVCKDGNKKKSIIDVVLPPDYFSFAPFWTYLIADRKHTHTNRIHENKGKLHFVHSKAFIRIRDIVKRKD